METLEIIKFAIFFFVVAGVFYLSTKLEIKENNNNLSKMDLNKC